MRLEIGNKIYRTSYGSIVSVHTITRLTNTLAIAKDGTRFKQDDYEQISVYGCSSWDSSCYNLEDDSLKYKLKLQNLRIQIRNMNINNLTVEQLERIVEIDNEPKF